MKRIFLVLMSMILIFGCIEQPSPGANVTTGNLTAPTAPSVNQTTAPAKNCTPSYSFTTLKTASLSGSGVLSVTASCAANKKLVVSINGKTAGASTIPSDSAIVNFNLVASDDGTNKVVVKSDGNTVHSVTWSITSIGHFDTSGKDNDPISIKNWKAIALNVSNPIEVKQVSAYMKRLSSLTLGSNIVLELRKDSAGEPGAHVANTSIPITKATLTPNWIYFPIDASLQKGRYWLVFKVDKEGDYVNIHYTPVDKQKKGNADHLYMDLVKNEIKQTWEQTKWGRLSFDRKYVFKVSTSSK